MGIERRQFPRFACKLPAVADGPRGPVRGTCTNLSRGGAFLDGVALPLGAMVTVTIAFPGGPAHFEMTVRRVVEEPRGVGLPCMRLESHELEALEAYTGAE